MGTRLRPGATAPRMPGFRCGALPLPLALDPQAADKGRGRRGPPVRAPGGRERAAGVPIRPAEGPFGPQEA